MNENEGRMLEQLGVEPYYEGVCYTQCAVHLVKNNPDRLLWASRLIYPEVARVYQTSVFCVVRRIRAVMVLTKAKSPDKFQEITHRSNADGITISEWLTALYRYSSRNQAAA